MTYNDIYLKVGYELGIPTEVVKEAYSYQWKFIRHALRDLPIRDPSLSEEEFSDMRLNFNFPSLGKLFLTYDRYKKIHKQIEIIQEIKRKKESEEDEYKED